MNFGDFLGGLVAPITEAVKGWGERAAIREQGRNNVAIAQAQADVARANASATLAQSQQDGEHEWEMAAVKQSETSWKDELWTLAVIFPLIIAFFPGGAAVVAVGFQAISAAPGWYQGIVAASVAFAFGIRHAINIVRDNWGRAAPPQNPAP
jgi:hypothetical protein